MGQTKPFARGWTSGVAGHLTPRVRRVFEVGGSLPSRATFGAPGDIVEQAARRVGLVAGALVGVSLVEVAIAHLWPLLTRPDYPTRAEKLDLAGNALLEALSLGVLLLSRTRSLAAGTRLRLGGVYLVVIAYVVSLTDHADHYWAGAHRQHGVPWVTGLILVFPVLVPMRPLPALLIGLVMAAMSPLAMWTHVALLGYSRPDFVGMVDSFPFLFAFVAAFSSRVVHQLGQEVGKARQLGAYTLESKLGSGGMGEVWVASHRFLARRAAVKLIRPPDGALDSRTALERFHREAQTTAGLKSPHTVDIYDYGTSEDGRLFYAMELLEGIDLDELIKTYGAQPPERVVHWLRQVCHSLGEAHGADLVHRDIKPANLYVCRYGMDEDFIKVLDFGLVCCRPSPDISQTGLTDAGHLVGTPAYMPPELSTGKHPVDARSDLYSLGCVAYWLLTARPVFEGASSMEILVRHVDQAPVAPSQFSPYAIAEELDRIVLVCLEKSPDRRPHSADDLARQLERCPLPEAWTPERAQAWWDERRPQSRAAEAATLAP